MIKRMKISTSYLIYTFFGILTVSICLHLYGTWSGNTIAEPLLVGSRWFVLAFIFIHAMRKRSLTTWILFSMLAGAEFGHDFQALAIHLNIISKIFLNLIKIIIAPLLFGTLVVGIAGHSNIRQVGRMGWKSILYFEIISTLALFIGLAAINLSKAGVGVTLPQAMAQGTLPEVPKQT